MTDHTDPQHISHGADGTRAVPTTPEAAQAHARIVEALADPFAFAVALLADAAVTMPRPPTVKPVPPKPARKPRPPRIGSPNPRFGEVNGC